MVWYVIAADPKLLVFLKAYRNTVPVLRHWCQKRKFLQGKRGIEKQPFQLPDFIAATGIAKIRQFDKCSSNLLCCDGFIRIAQYFLVLKIEVVNCSHKKATVAIELKRLSTIAVTISYE
ncbi:hypothetical protein Ddye_016308 [Dipteronia dyeriana]|uniref:DUF382 domain-containing protein n=1 Tax=Dipteronia dyeriana TaxID=168575 RepID=A0AAD9U708_9ROSI|nr:hypothetical protein Ddye_016308 [Dipteronia dyeriana]